MHNIQFTYQWAYLFTSKPEIFYYLAIRPGCTSQKVQYTSNLCCKVGWTNQTLTIISDCRSSETVNNTSIFRYLLEFHPRFMVWSSEYLIPVLRNVSRKSTWLPHMSAMWTNPKGSPNMFRYRSQPHHITFLPTMLILKSALGVYRNGLYCSVNSGFGWEDLYFIIQSVHVNRAIVQLHPLVLPEPAPNRSGNLSSLRICKHYCKENMKYILNNTNKYRLDLKHLQLHNSLQERWSTYPSVCFIHFSSSLVCIQCG